MKKILFLIPNLGNGGAERVLVNLVNNLDYNKYDVTVKTIFDYGINRKFLNDSVTYKYVFPRVFHGINKISALLPACLLYKLFIKEKYDIEIAYLEGTSAKIISGCSNQNTRLISWIHTEMKKKGIYTEGFLNCKDATNRYSKFDKIVCVSEDVKDAFVVMSGVKESAIVLYNTNETERIRKQGLEDIETGYISDGITTICSVGKIEDTKGFDRLLEAHKRLMDEGIKHKVLIIGEGSEKEKLSNQAKEWGVENSFLFVGFQENPYRFISKTDLYVCSSRREGFSTAVTEALVLGIPVVSTCCSGSKELLGKNNEYGIVVDNSTDGIYEGMKLMLSNKKILEKYKQLAIERGSVFSKENTVHAVERVLDSI